MSKHPFESDTIYGLHDPGGEHLMDACGVKGWVLVSEEIGSDPNDYGGSHTNYADLTNRGFSVMVRLNNGYYGPGTLPPRVRYADFAQRCANYVGKLPQVHIWIIGNEMNMTAERPGARIEWSRGAARGVETGDPQPTPRDFRTMLSVLAPRSRGGTKIIDPGETITPEAYAECYRLCRNAIHGVPGHGNDLVLIGSVAPWNENTGDWIVYFQSILNQLGPHGCDGITVHTYTHGTDVDLIADESKMGSPYERHHYNFRTYQDFMHAIPANMRHLPVYITETDQDGSWEDRGDSQWIQRAYSEVDWWNQQAGNQQIRAMILYRWEDHDHYVMKGKGGIENDFKAAMRHGYRWRQGAVATGGPTTMPSPSQPDNGTPVELGKTLVTAAYVNIRPSAGHVNPVAEALGQLTPGTSAKVLDGSESRDQLTWWRVQSTLESGTSIEGWVAETDPQGIRLLIA